MSNDTRKPRASDRDRRRTNGRPSHPGSSAQNRGRSQADVRANAKRSYERYVELARAAIQAGDPIEGENLYQHAEHYFRTMREQDVGRDDQSERLP